MRHINELEKAMLELNFSKKTIDYVLDYETNLKRQNLPVIFDISHLANLMGVSIESLNYYIKNSNDFYKNYKIRKKSGGFRTISAPSLNLKKIQRWILDNVLVYFHTNECSFGFKKNSNIKYNAQQHTSKEIVYNIDLKDFFPSISGQSIYFLFYNLGYSSSVSFAFMRLLSFNNSLPQGSPCSPCVANIICFNMDNELQSFATKIDATYTRYADDLTFSTNNKLTNFKKDTIKIKKIIEYYGFKLNKKKERIQLSYQPQIVTGLIVNDGVKVRRKFKKKIEQEIYYCEKFGVYSHLDRSHKSHKSFYKEYIYGKVNFLNDIEPEIARDFRKRLDNLDWSY